MQITTEPQATVVNGLPIEHQTSLSSGMDSERPINHTPYPAIVVSNQHANTNAHINMINNPENTQVVQLTQQNNVQYSFPKHVIQQNETVVNINTRHAAEKVVMSSSSSHILANDISKKERPSKKHRGDRDKEKEIKDKKNQIWQEREREWKLLQQQRQQENKKQQQHTQDNYARPKQNKTPDWRKTCAQNNKSSRVRSEQQAQPVASSGNNNTVQIQLSDYISSSQPAGRADSQLQQTSVASVTHAERIIEHSQSSSSFQVQTVAATTAITTVENSTPFWVQDVSRSTSYSLPGTSSRTAESSEEQIQPWLAEHEQPHPQFTIQPQRQYPEQQIQQQEQQQISQQEQSSFNRSALPPTVSQVSASTPNMPVPSENDPHISISSAPAHHLAVPRSEVSTPLSKQSDISLEQATRQKQQEALQKQQQIQHLQKQQQLQQQEVLQREQRKQLVLAQHQQQEFIQMQLKQHRFPPQQSYQDTQPPRQANQFTVNTKEMPEIDTEEEHHERLQFLYRQRQMQKQMQARQYMMQTQQTPAPQTVWVNNAQLIQGLPQGIPTDPSQQRIFLEQKRAFQRHAVQLAAVEKHPHHIANPFNQPSIPAPVVESTPKFNFHQPPKNGPSDSQFLHSSTEVTQSQINISTYTTQASHTSTASIFSDFAESKSDRKALRKDYMNSVIDLSSHSGQFGNGFSNGIEREQQRDGGLASHALNKKDEMLTVGEETCVTVEEGHVRRIDIADPILPENDKGREHEQESTGNELGAKSLVPPYGTANSGLQNFSGNSQLVLPPPQLSLSPQQQHMLLQAQQQQLLWQQAHSQLQHQYQVMYQQLQQLQIQLQQTQDPALHQRVLRQQQQLRFLQTQILQHWQQGQIVVQQIHLQAFGLNAMYNHLDPTQQKHMQMYQQELVRQQQQWAQQFGGAFGLNDIFGRSPQDSRQPTEVSGSEVFY